jgi:hypothetical protein
LHIALDAVEVQSQMALDAVLGMSARKLHIVHLDHAFTTIFATSSLLAKMVAGLVSALAGLPTRENRMHRFRVTSRLA